MAQEFKWDQAVFDRTLREYMQVSSRTMAQIINAKAYYIAANALWNTPKASAEKIRLALGETKGMMLTKLKSGKFSRNKKNLRSFFGAGEGRTKAPLLALVVQKQHRLAGKPSPWAGKSREAGAAAMLEAMRIAFNARMRSIAFLRAGWLPSIRTLRRVCAFSDLTQARNINSGDARQYGRPKGYAVPGRDGFNPVALIVNEATTMRDKRGALIRFGAPALQQAFDNETLSMKEYIQRKLGPDAAVFNAKQK